MSRLAAADRIVAQARRRLILAHAAELAATGVLLGALLAVVVATARWWLGDGALPAAWLAAPLVGGVVGLGLALVRSPACDRAALVLDRAAGAHEAFVSALTAVDADPAFRELSAAYALRALGDRPLRRLLPFAVPRRAAPALASLALVAALSVVAGAPGDGAALAQDATVIPLPGGGGGASAGGDTNTTDTSAAAPVPGTGAGLPGVATRPSVADLPALSDAEVERLAADLAERGVDAGTAALRALREGDRERAEALLKAALTAPTAHDGTPGDRAAGSADGAGAASASGSGAAVAPGAWSAGAWPLRYDREVRAWLRRQAAANGGGDARTEER